MRGSHVKPTSWAQSLSPDENVKTSYSFTHFFHTLLEVLFTSDIHLNFLFSTTCRTACPKTKKSSYFLIVLASLVWNWSLSSYQSLVTKSPQNYTQGTRKGNYRKSQCANAENVLAVHNGVLCRLTRIFSLHPSVCLDLPCEKATFNFCWIYCTNYSWFMSPLCLISGARGKNMGQVSQTRWDLAHCWNSITFFFFFTPAVKIGWS